MWPFSKTTTTKNRQHVRKNGSGALSRMMMMMMMMIGGRGAAEEGQGLFRDEGGWANDQPSHSVGISWAQQWRGVGCVHSIVNEFGVSNSGGAVTVLILGMLMYRPNR
jgi:hypothetical protein